jgi:hypothetical protein
VQFIIVASGVHALSIAGALATFIGADNRLSSEYFVTKYPHSKDDDDIYKIRTAVVETLDTWGPKQLQDYKVALVTYSDEVLFHFNENLFSAT